MRRMKDWWRRLSQRTLMVGGAVVAILIVTAAVALAAEYVLYPTGDVEVVNEAVFEALDEDAATGTGVFNPFVRLNGTDVVQGYNTDYRPLQFDEDASWTDSIPLSDVPYALYDGVLYREFQLDINQTASDAGRYVSLDEVQIWLGGPDAATINGFVPATDTTAFGTFPGFTLQQIYNLDADEDNWLKLDYILNKGSGKRDLRMLIPDAYFGAYDDACRYLGTGCDQYVVFYTLFGYEYSNNDGFEEWGVAVYNTVSGYKWHDINADGIWQQPDEPGLGDWQICAQPLDNQGLPAGEPVCTLTFEDGRYTLSLLDGTYEIYEICEPDWHQSHPAPTGGVCGSGTYTLSMSGASREEGRNFGNYQSVDQTVVKYHDLNADGDRDADEPVLSNWEFFIDANGNEDWDADETKQATDDSGETTFTLTAGASYSICEVLQTDWNSSDPAGATLCKSTGTVEPDTPLDTLYFGNWLSEPDIDLEKYVSVDDQATWHDADSLTGPYTEVGSDVYFRFVVTNTGNVPLSPITLSDSDFDVSGCTLTDPLGAGDSFECIIGPYAAVAGQHTNTGTATGDYESQTYTDEDDANYLGVGAYITIEPDATNEVGDSHTFTITVTAVGAEPTDWAITPAVNPTPDAQSDTCDSPQVAADGMSATCSLTITDSDPGQFTASAEADVTFPESTVVSVTTDGQGDSSQSATKTYVDAAIQVTPLEAVNLVGDPHTITAAVQIDDGSGVGWTDAPDGTLVTFSLPTNTADATFVGGEDTCTTVNGACSVQINADAPGDVLIHAATDVSVGDLTLHRETDGEGANSGDGQKAYVEPGIHLEKYVSVDDQATWDDADNPTGPYADVGSDVYFRFVVFNTEEVELSNIVLTDTDFTTEIGEQCELPTTLAAGNSFECIIGPFPAEAGQHANTGTVTGEYEEETYSDEDDAHYFGRQPAYTFQKLINGEDADTVEDAVSVEAGDTLTFTYMLTNIGNITITWTSLTDDVFGDLTAECGLPIDVPVGETATCDILREAGSYEDGKENIGTASVDGLDDQTDPAWYQTSGPTAVTLLYFHAQGTGSAIRLDWGAAAEVDMLGYYLYRGETTRFGAAKRLTFLFAEGSNSTYRYLDEDVEPGKVYWYWLVSVETDGSEQRDGPVPATMVAGAPVGGFRVFLPFVGRGN
jgi:hypothetical protein